MGGEFSNTTVGIIELPLTAVNGISIFPTCGNLNFPTRL